MQHMLLHDITLKHSSSSDHALDEHAGEVIKNIVSRLSALSGIVPGSVAAYVTGLTDNGEIVIQVSANGTRSNVDCVRSTREQFLLSIYVAVRTTQPPLPECAERSAR
jgi:hypothetical protein